MAKKKKQAYKQAPWRRQIESIGLSLLPVVSIAIFISIYLIISAQAAAFGLEIMNLHYEEEEILRSIANLRTELAWATSYEKLQKRAEKIGLEPAPVENLHYMIVNGYKGRSPVLIAPPPGNDANPIHFTNEFYTLSLSRWILETFFLAQPLETGGAYE